MTVVWQGETTPTLMLGTVQLGMPYGIANKAGQPDRTLAQAIVREALDWGIEYFDTAQAYGESEQVLGEVFAALGAHKRVRACTKLAAALDPRDGAGLASAIEASFQRLGVERLWCLMLHRPAWLEHWEGPLGETLRRYRDSGRIEHLGVSLLSPVEGEAALGNPDIEVVQAPCNAWDRRALEGGLLARAEALGKLVCVRSVYLQGLLTMSPTAAGTRVAGAGPVAEAWHVLAEGWGMSTVEAALRFGRKLGCPLVVGAESVEQIHDTARHVSAPPLTEGQLEQLRQALAGRLDEYVIEPWRWGAPKDDP